MAGLDRTGRQDNSASGTPRQRQHNVALSGSLPLQPALSYCCAPTCVRSVPWTAHVNLQLGHRGTDPPDHVKLISSVFWRYGKGHRPKGTKGCQQWFVDGTACRIEI